MEQAASLLCCENGALGAERLCKATRDPALSDRRVLANLLQREPPCQPAVYAFKCVQSDVKEHMRRVLAYWMEEVCEEQRCQEAVFPHAMSLLDRLLSRLPLPKEQLQLAGAVCLFVSSKLRETRPLSAGCLAQCADHSFTVKDVTDWELLVLHWLRWEVSVVTAHDFLEPLLERLPLQSYLGPGREEAVRRQAQTFIIMCVIEYQFAVYSASTVAAASVAAAVRGTVPHRPTAAAAAADCLDRLHCATDVDRDVLQRCLDEIEATLRAFAEEQASRPARGQATGPPSGDRTADYSDAGTPTDVREVEF